MSTVVLTNEEILEGNILIADFKGWVHHADSEYDKYEMSQLKFHSSWDTLIPACQQACSFNVKDHSKIIMVDNSVMTYVNKIGVFKRGLLRMDIEHTFKGLVGFVKWFNQQCSKNNARPVSPEFTAKKL